jgi:hypothetical protein
VNDDRQPYGDFRMTNRVEIQLRMPKNQCVERTHRSADRTRAGFVRLGSAA